MVNCSVTRFRTVLGCVKSYYRVIRLSSTQGVNSKQFEILKNKLAVRPKQFTPGFVEDVKRDVLSAGNKIDVSNFDSLFIEICIQNKFFDLGKNYFDYLHDRGRVGLALVRKYCRLCYCDKESCSDRDKELLVSLYEKVKEQYPLLDETTCEQLSLGLSVTPRWREGVQLLNKAREFGKPTNQHYSSIICAAFLNGDETLGWNLLNESVIEGNKPHESIYPSLLRPFNDSSILKLCNFLETNSIHMPVETARLLCEKKKAEITKITHEGVCHCCSNSLAPISIDEDEFTVLTEDFLDPVLIGKDVFLKTKPQELNEFKSFLQEAGKTDVVLDGLNIAYGASKKTCSPYSMSKLLMDVVKYFRRQNMRIIVLGRKHMEKWTKSNMNYIKNNSNLFLTDDLSSDDPYLLYATMRSGLGTKFVSRDLMRGHKFLLKTPAKKKIFSKWQQKHQMLLTRVESDGRVYLRDISSYLMSPQFYNGRWHIPIAEPNKPGIHPHVQALNLSWLCFQLSNDCT